jgi:glycine dehydrogenase
MAAMYAVYHGPDGLTHIAKRTALLAQALADGIRQVTAGRDTLAVVHEHIFDTLYIKVYDTKTIAALAAEKGINFRYFDNQHIGISLDETTTQENVAELLDLFRQCIDGAAAKLRLDAETLGSIPTALTRTSEFLTHPVFNTHHSETAMMRYIRMLEGKDLSLNHSMIPLGSCTMKLNAASEMLPLSWSHWSKIHPFAPKDQAGGYQYIVDELSNFLCAITAFDACSLQPNSGAQGEYAGLLSIKKFHESRGESHRKTMLIPISAHGTNPASAVMCGMKVVVVNALENGYIDVEDLRTKASRHAVDLAGIMITYPSTYGVYEETVKEITDIVHQFGGQVYMDGANMNAQSGLTAPGLIGADVCHLNLHKTFAIPHGGGGPGMGPICCKAHLAPFLPGHTQLSQNGNPATGAVSAAPYGSASILLISYGYIKMLGAEGVRNATVYAILNANYMRSRLEHQFEILYTNHNGECAHEFIVDLRPFKKSAEIDAEDVAKRLIDYGFHAPTMSFPVPGTIMIEPTESEDKAELDRFCDALLSIRREILMIEEGALDRKDNPLKNAPHTVFQVCSDEWQKPYSREMAAFPLDYVKEAKFWPSVARVNNTHGDRNLICTCEPVSAYAEEA